MTPAASVPTPPDLSAAYPARYRAIWALLRQPRVLTTAEIARRLATKRARVDATISRLQIPAYAYADRTRIYAADDLRTIAAELRRVDTAGHGTAVPR